MTPPSKLQLLKSRLDVMVKHIGRMPPDQQADLAPTSFANQFNEVLKELREQYPDYAAGLPVHVGTSGPFRMMHKCDVKYLDMSMFAAQAIAVIEMAENG